MDNDNALVVVVALGVLWYMSQKQASAASRASGLNTTRTNPTGTQASSGNPRAGTGGGLTGKTPPPPKSPPPKSKADKVAGLLSGLVDVGKDTFCLLNPDACK